jgi:uncharacterized protein YjbI with pentapeptide repeats
MSENRVFEHQHIDDAVFRDCAMARTRFDDANLSNAVFSNVSLQSAKFGRNCAMAHAKFDDANLSNAVFSDVNLQGAKFGNVNLKDVTIKDANIEGLTIFGYNIQALIKAEILRSRSTGASAGTT